MSEREAGQTLLELLAVLAIMGIGLAAVGPNLRPAEAPLQTAVTQLEGFMRQARSRAMATTSACRVRPTAGDLLVAEQASTCDAETWTLENGFELELPREVTVTDPEDWSICFGSRGLASENLVLVLSHPRLGTRRVEVLLGGGTRELS